MILKNWGSLIGAVKGFKQISRTFMFIPSTCSLVIGFRLLVVILAETILIPTTQEEYITSCALNTTLALSMLENCYCHLHVSF